MSVFIKLLRSLAVNMRGIICVLHVGLLVCFCSTSKPSGSENHPVVTIKEGKLRGYTSELRDGSKYHSFKGIPFASPPVGKLRFKAPLPPQPWGGILDATEHRPSCPQLDVTTNQLSPGNEMCLYLNVYTKSLESKSKLPVMVFIHGGSWMSGEGDATTFGPEHFIQHDVILVTINYRLEVLGFLDLEIPEVPGNAAMKDQVAALKWVKNNIAKFGGDPDNVTVFGESSGAAAATYHMLSPMSKGLFHKVIAQSGTCLEDWAIDRYAKERAFRVGKYLGKDTKDVYELLDFLQSVPPLDLAGVTFKTMTEDEKHRGLPEYFVPVVEKSFPGVESFINKEPTDILKSGKVNKVPLLIGYNSAEGLIMLQDQLQKVNFTNQNLHYLVPRELAPKLPKNSMDDIGQRIRMFYAGNREFSNDTAEALVNIQTDANFLYNSVRFMSFYAPANQSIYMYRFNYNTDLNLLKIDLGLQHMKGACHADDLFYFFNNEANKPALDAQKKLRELVYNLTKMWTDFAKTGNPTPDNSLGVTWNKYTTSSKKFMNLEEPLSMGQAAEQKRVEFWDKIYCESGAPCIQGEC